MNFETANNKIQILINQNNTNEATIEASSSDPSISLPINQERLNTCILYKSEKKIGSVRSSNRGNSLVSGTKTPSPLPIYASVDLGNIVPQDLGFIDYKVLLDLPPDIESTSIAKKTTSITYNPNYVELYADGDLILKGYYPIYGTSKTAAELDALYVPTANRKAEYTANFYYTTGGSDYYISGHITSVVYNFNPSTVSCSIPPPTTGTVYDKIDASWIIGIYALPTPGTYAGTPLEITSFSNSGFSFKGTLFNGGPLDMCKRIDWVANDQTVSASWSDFVSYPDGASRAFTVTGTIYKKVGGNWVIRAGTSVTLNASTLTSVTYLYTRYIITWDTNKYYNFGGLTSTGATEGNAGNITIVSPYVPSFVNIGRPCSVINLKRNPDPSTMSSSYYETMKTSRKTHCFIQTNIDKYSLEIADNPLFMLPCTEAKTLQYPVYNKNYTVSGDYYVTTDSYTLTPKIIYEEPTNGTDIQYHIEVYYFYPEGYNVNQVNRQQ